MTRLFKRAAQIRLNSFAAEAKRTREYVKLSLMTSAIVAELEIPKGFSLEVNGDNKPYIILDDANDSIWNTPDSIWNIYS